MCGLVGVAGNLALKDENLMRRLLLLDYFRGPDSTGMAAIRNSGEVEIAKLPSNPMDLFDTLSFRKALNGNNSCAFIGHNRAATRGAVNKMNAHPFQVDHIIGAHNGTLDYQPFADLERKLEEKYPVDSMAIIASIAKFGIKETIESIYGSWSLVYVNLKDGTLNFIRNKERPMWYAYSSDFKHLYWASEFKMIETAVEMGGYNEKLYEDKKGHCFFATAEDTHYSFPMEMLVKGGELPKPIVKKMEGKKEPAPFSIGAANKSGSDPFQRDNILTIGAPQKTDGKTGTDSKTPTSTQKIVTIFGSPSDPFAGVVDRKRFEQMAYQGCGFCHKKVEFTDAGISLYLRDNLILCEAHSPRGQNGINRIYTNLPAITQVK